MTFDQWWNETWAPAFEVVPGAMQSAWMEVAKGAWQASRAQAIEEAQSVCSKKAADASKGRGGFVSAQIIECGLEIRSLKGG